MKLITVIAFGAAVFYIITGDVVTGLTSLAVGLILARFFW